MLDRIVVALTTPLPDRCIDESTSPSRANEAERPILHDDDVVSTQESHAAESAVAISNGRVSVQRQLCIVPRRGAAHLVSKTNGATCVRLDLDEMERDVSVEALEELNAVTNQDRHDRIPHLVSQPEPKAFGRDHAASHEPDAAIAGTQTFVHELREIAGVEFN
jgi:hypothetical protein